MTNIFENPQYYLKEFYERSPFTSEMIDSSINEYKGLSMMCVWLTKLCPLKCEKCFFRSNMSCSGMVTEEHTFTEDGMNKLINFINHSNNGYLMLSGGGDPMMCADHVAKLIRHADTHRIVIVTSGYWGNSYHRAEKEIAKLYKAYKDRTGKECKVILRLSIDEFHENALNSNNAYKNIIKVYASNYAQDKNFSLMIHTMRNDAALEKLSSEMGARIEYGALGESDNDKVIKIVPKKANMIYNDYVIPVGISKLFYSDLLINLNPPYSNNIIQAVKVLTDDMENSEQGNPSYIQNSLGKKGLDFWVDYNGNVTTWFNQDWHQLFNLYTDSYEDMVRKTFENPITAFMLRKGYEYRNKIITEVNPLAVFKAQAVNLRDYYAALLLEEDKTKLYFAIRALQVFMSEFYISDKNLYGFSEEIQKTVSLEPEELMKLYNGSDYDILDQYCDESTFDKESWKDVLLMIELGHFKVNPDKLREKKQFYEKETGESCDNLIQSCLSAMNDDYYFRFHKRISFMKQEAYEKVRNHHD